MKPSPYPLIESPGRASEPGGGASRLRSGSIRSASCQGVTALAAGALLLIVGTTAGCGASAPPPSAVTVYLAVDREVAAPVIEEFERRSAIQVTAIYESDSADAASLAAILGGTDDRAAIDVLWTDETIRATQLKYLGALASYRSPNAGSIPAQYRDFDAYWTGMAARLRVLAYDAARVAPENAPTSVAELAEPAWTDRFAMPDLGNGMTAFHVAALYSDMGDGPADELLRRLSLNGLRLLSDDSAVLTALSQGDVAAVMTSSDQILLAEENGQPITVVAPDADGLGVPVLPGAVAITAWAAHPRAARALVDYLVSDDVERMLSQSRARLVPLRESTPPPAGLPAIGEIRTMPLHYSRAATGLERALERATSILNEQR